MYDTCYFEDNIFGMLFSLFDIFIKYTATNENILTKIVLLFCPDVSLFFLRSNVTGRSYKSDRCPPT